MKKKDRRKCKVKTKEILSVTVSKGTKVEILKLTNNVSEFVDYVIQEYIKKIRTPLDR